MMLEGIKHENGSYAAETNPEDKWHRILLEKWGMYYILASNKYTDCMGKGKIHVVLNS